MWVYRPMTSFLYPAARENASRAARHRLDEPQTIPQHGCIPAEPTSVSPGRFIVAPPRHAVLKWGPMQSLRAAHIVYFSSQLYRNKAEDLFTLGLVAPYIG